MCIVKKKLKLECGKLGQKKTIYRKIWRFVTSKGNSTNFIDQKINAPEIEEMEEIINGYGVLNCKTYWVPFPMTADNNKYMITAFVNQDRTIVIRNQNYGGFNGFIVLEYIKKEDE